MTAGVGAYRFEVWAWSRQKLHGVGWPPPRYWAMQRSGFCFMELTVGREQIVLRHPFVGGWLARLLMLGCVLDTRDVVLLDEHPTFRPTLAPREAVVISGRNERGKQIDLAIAPSDRKSLDRLREALADVGVRPAEPEPFPQEWS